MNKGLLLRFDWRLQTQSNKSLTLSDRACTLILFIALGINSKIMSKKAEKFIEKYTTKDQNDWLVQKKDIIAKLMESYHTEQLRIANVSGSLPKVCKGCGSLSTKVIDKKYLACCPDSNYIPLEDYCKDSIYPEKRFYIS